MPIHAHFRAIAAATRRATGRVASAGAFREMGRVFKSAKTSLHVVDDALASFVLSRNKRGMIEFNGHSAGVLNRVIRSGDLKALIRMSGKNVPITSAHQAAFRRMLSDACPEIHIKDLNDKISVARKRLQHMDAKLENLDKVSSSGRADLKKAESRLLDKVKKGSVVVLLVGTVVVGAEWLAKATAARRGCFMFTTLNGRTSSCKVAEFSCRSADTGGHPCRSRPQNLYNNTLVLMHLVDLPDTDERKLALASATQTPVAQLSADIARLVDDKFDEVAKCIEALRPEQRDFHNVCGITNSRLVGPGMGNDSECRMCTPTADPTHTTYIDSSQYPDNVAFECVENPTMLATLVDTAASTGIDLLSGLGGTVFGGLKRLGLWVGLGILVVVVATLIMRFARPRFRARHNSHHEEDDRTPLLDNDTDE